MTPIAAVFTLRGHRSAYLLFIILIAAASINLAPFKVRNGAYVNQLDYSITLGNAVFIVALLAGCRSYWRYCAERRARRRIAS